MPVLVGQSITTCVHFRRVRPPTVVAQNARRHLVAGDSILTRTLWVTKNPVFGNKGIIPSATSARLRRLHSRVNPSVRAGRINRKTRRMRAEHRIDEVWYENSTL